MPSLGTKNSKPVKPKVAGTRNKHFVNRSSGTTSIFLYIDLGVLVVDYTASYILMTSSKHIYSRTAPLTHIRCCLSIGGFTIFSTVIFHCIKATFFFWVMECMIKPVSSMCISQSPHLLSFKMSPLMRSDVAWNFTTLTSTEWVILSTLLVRAYWWAFTSNTKSLMLLTSPKKSTYHIPKSALCPFSQMSSFKILGN